MINKIKSALVLKLLSYLGLPTAHFIINAKMNMSPQHTGRDWGDGPIGRAWIPSIHSKAGLVAHICNLRSGEAEADRSLDLPGQPETLPHKLR